MKKYNAYKDSGVSWMGEVPEHWGIERLKNLVSCNDEALTERTSPNTIIQYVEISDVDGTNGITNTSDYTFSKAPSRARRITRQNDIIISTVRTYLKAIAVIDKPNLIVSTGFAVLRPKHCNNIYLSYALKTEGFSTEVIRLSEGIGYPSIKVGNLLSISLPLPPPSEQRAIVAYLDQKVGDIDRLIEKTETKIAQLKELKQATIAQAVTQGIDPNVPLKDSGIAWIGKVPEHWEEKKIRSILQLSKRKSENEDYQLLSLSQYTGVTAKQDNDKTGMFRAESTIGYNIVRKGQFVMNIMLAWNGSYAISELDGVISPAYCVFDFIDNNVDKKYFDYLLSIDKCQQMFKGHSTGLILSRLRLYPNKFLPLPIFLPPPSEQRAIVDYITAKTEKIDRLMDRESQIVERLKELKQRLISDAVTGKIKVEPNA